jgi:hypothetical protein
LTSPQEPIERPQAASVRKLQTKGGLAETITYLGWTINTRALTIALPIEKAKAWTDSITKMSAQRSPIPIQHQQLATLVGRLNHVGFIIPQARHFINRIRRAEQKAHHHRITRLPNETKKDLQLWIILIAHIQKGISLNNIVFRKPTSL